MSLKVNEYVLIYKNQFDCLFSEKGDIEYLRKRKEELNNSIFFTAWIVQVKELP